MKTALLKIQKPEGEVFSRAMIERPRGHSPLMKNVASIHIDVPANIGDGRETGYLTIRFVMSVFKVYDDNYC